MYIQFGKRTRKKQPHTHKARTQRRQDRHKRKTNDGKQRRKTKNIGTLYRPFVLRIECDVERAVSVIKQRTRRWVCMSFPTFLPKFRGLRTISCCDSAAKGRLSPQSRVASHVGFEVIVNTSTTEHFCPCTVYIGAAGNQRKVSTSRLAVVPCSCPWSGRGCSTKPVHAEDTEKLGE